MKWDVQSWNSIDEYLRKMTHHLQGAKNLMKTVFPAVNSATLSLVRETTFASTAASERRVAVRESFIISVDRGLCVFCRSRYYATVAAAQRPSWRWVC